MRAKARSKQRSAARRANASFWLMAGLMLAMPASADTPVLHEYFEPDPIEDLRFAATTPDGSMPAAIETKGGAVSAPPPGRERRDTETAYGGTSTPNSADASYRIDRNTTRPNVVGYDDPFTPAVTPFKRLYAYDLVDEGLELSVYDKSLRRLELGGQVKPGEDSFYADLFVDLAPGASVRVPSVGPGARVLAAEVEPATPFELLRDGAGNWFVRGEERRRVRMILQLSVPRAVFGSPFGPTTWRELAPFLTPLPSVVHSAADEVLSELGLSRRLSPTESVAKLVAHFRAFAPSDELPQAESGVELYKELALSQKGVCRHRAYAFVITALRLGLPSRLIHNEAHAWVEVFDGNLWHLIDLGGAAGRLDFAQDSPLYTPPQDPYVWPEGSESASALAGQPPTMGSQPGPTGSGSNGASSGDPTGASSAPAPHGSSGTLSGTDPQSATTTSKAEAPEEPTTREETGPPKAFVTLTLSSSESRRGRPVRLQGEVTSSDRPCSFARVDVVLRSEHGDRIPIGALPTNADGRFDGSLTIPLNISLGEYDVNVSTPGTPDCGPSAR